VLVIDKVSAGYGSGDVLHEVSLQVRDSEIISLLGANGSGKSTLINAISGFLPVRGRILLDERDIAGKPTHYMFGEGIVQVSQMRDLFTALTVLENQQLGEPRK
jgi:branched-chain amino acid transport system ATP-binding protein